MDDKSHAVTKISCPQYRAMQIKNLEPATIEALKKLSIATSSGESVDQLSSCNKLSASLEQIRSKRNIRLFEKLDAIKQDFSCLNMKIAKMEESILDLKESTSNLVRSLPSEDQRDSSADLNSAR